MFDRLVEQNNVSCCFLKGLKKKVMFPLAPNSCFACPLSLVDCFLYFGCLFTMASTLNVRIFC